jgi:hypothetical protein
MTLRRRGLVGCGCRPTVDSPIQAHGFEDARHDAGVGNGSHHLQLAAIMGTPAQINSEYPHRRAIQLIGVVHALAAVPSAPPALLAALGRATMAARSRALGANNP